MIIDLLGFAATALVLTGYALNSQQRLQLAAMVWILGDALWVWYDLLIDNIPHIALSACIVVLNVRAIWRLQRRRRKRSRRVY
jgi:hypothetical protein